MTYRISYFDNQIPILNLWPDKRLKPGSRYEFSGTLLNLTTIIWHASLLFAWNMKIFNSVDHRNPATVTLSILLISSMVIGGYKMG